MGIEAKAPGKEVVIAPPLERWVLLRGALEQKRLAVLGRPIYKFETTTVTMTET